MSRPAAFKLYWVVKLTARSRIRAISSIIIVNARMRSAPLSARSTIPSAASGWMKAPARRIN
jgi:hypothetical protein